MGRELRFSAGPADGGLGRNPIMKSKLLLGAVLVVAVLFFLNRMLNETPRYMESSPSTGLPASGEVREKFVVGFLPVT